MTKAQAKLLEQIKVRASGRKTVVVEVTGNQKRTLLSLCRLGLVTAHHVPRWNDHLYSARFDVTILENDTEVDILEEEIG